MDAAKHTPGPWQVDLTVDKRSWGYIRPANGEVMQGALKRPSVARVHDTQCSHAEAQANARLIAAAPELLETLRIVYEAEFGSLEAVAPIGTYWERAKTAIAKAEGR